MIRTITCRLLLVLAVVALALPLAAAPPTADPDSRSSMEPAHPLVHFWTTLQKVFGLASDETSAPPDEDPQAGPLIDPFGASGEDGGEAGPLIDPFGG